MQPFVSPSVFGLDQFDVKLILFLFCKIVKQFSSSVSCGLCRDSQNEPQPLLNKIGLVVQKYLVALIRFRVV